MGPLAFEATQLPTMPLLTLVLWAQQAASVKSNADTAVPATAARLVQPSHIDGRRRDFKCLFRRRRASTCNVRNAGYFIEHAWSVANLPSPDNHMHKLTRSFMHGGSAPLSRGTSFETRPVS